MEYLPSSIDKASVSEENDLIMREERLNMLYPINTATRSVIDLSGIWNFKLDKGRDFKRNGIVRG